MTRDEANKVPLGIYLIIWKGGKHTRALVAADVYDNRVLYCHDWTADSHDVLLMDYIEGIERLIFIM